MANHIEVERLAALARIAITPEEAERLGKDIENIVNYVSEISEAAVDAPTSSAEERGDVYNVFRDDNSPHERGAYADTLLAQAPGREGDYVRVKKIL